jgi:hypothetical protein
MIETGVLTPYIGPTTTAAVSVGPVSGLPRLDYYDSTCPKLLLEPSRTNDLQFSEQLDNAYWNKDGATITANNTISPDGYQSADLINYTGGNNRVFRLVTKAASALTYTLTAYVKRNTLDVLRLNLDGGSTANKADAIFDLSTGTLTSTSVLGTFTNQSGSILDVGNGWYRCRLTVTTGTEVSIRSQFFGTTSESAYIWGCQLELGAYASSYIPTLGASVTRVADAASKTGISSLIGQTEGTVFTELDVRIIVPTPSPRRPISLEAGTDVNSLIINFATTGAIQIVLGGVARETGLNVSSTNGVVKIAIAYSASGFVTFVNGILRDTYTGAWTQPTWSSIGVGGSVNTATREFGDRIAQALLFKTRLDNATLQSLTTL